MEEKKKKMENVVRNCVALSFTEQSLHVTEGKTPTRR